MHNFYALNHEELFVAWSMLGWLDYINLCMSEGSLNYGACVKEKDMEGIKSS
jgi:hypothetical protein